MYERFLIPAQTNLLFSQHAVPLQTAWVWQQVEKFPQSGILRTSQRWNLYWFQQWHDKWGLVSALINEVFIISCFPTSFHPRFHCFAWLDCADFVLHNETGNNGSSTFSLLLLSDTCSFVSILNEWLLNVTLSLFLSLSSLFSARGSSDP